jgi:hypothetical protein
MHLQDILPEHRALIEHWNHLPVDMRFQLSADMHLEGVDRIVPFKDGPFDRLALSDGKSDTFYAGENTADFNGLMEAAMASYRATCDRSDPHVNHAHDRIFLSDELQEAQRSVENAVEMDVIDWMRKNLPENLRKIFVDTPRRDVCETDGLRSCVIEAIEHTIDAYTTCSDQVGILHANAILNDEVDEAWKESLKRIGKRFRDVLLTTAGPMLEYDPGEILFLRNARGKIDLYVVTDKEDGAHEGHQTVTMVDQYGKERVIHYSLGSPFNRSIIGVASGYMENDHAIASPVVQVAPRIIMANGAMEVPPPGIAPDAYMVSFDGVGMGSFRHPELAATYAGILEEQLKKGDVMDVSEVDIKAWTAIVNDDEHENASGQVEATKEREALKDQHFLRVSITRDVPNRADIHIEVPGGLEGQALQDYAKRAAINALEDPDGELHWEEDLSSSEGLAVRAQGVVTRLEADPKGFGYDVKSYLEMAARGEMDAEEFLRRTASMAKFHGFVVDERLVDEEVRFAGRPETVHETPDVRASNSDLPTQS